MLKIRNSDRLFSVLNFPRAAILDFVSHTVAAIGCGYMTTPGLTIVGGNRKTMVAAEL